MLTQDFPDKRGERGLFNLKTSKHLVLTLLNHNTSTTGHHETSLQNVSTFKR